MTRGPVSSRPAIDAQRAPSPWVRHRSRRGVGLRVVGRNWLEARLGYWRGPHRAASPRTPHGMPRRVRSTRMPKPTPHAQALLPRSFFPRVHPCRCSLFHPTWCRDPQVRHRRPRDLTRPGRVHNRAVTGVTEPKRVRTRALDGPAFGPVRRRGPAPPTRRGRGRRSSRLRAPGRPSARRRPRRSP